MKLSLSVVFGAVIGVGAEQYNYYNQNAANKNAQNYQGYASYSSSSSGYNSSDINAYDQQYYSNYDADYVQEMNYDNGNFQYYDADGEYDASFSSAGYYDEYGSFHYYYANQGGGDYAAVDDAAATEYYQDWQNNGGASGYYDSSGSWQKSKYESVPCQTYSSQQVYQYAADDQVQGDDESYNSAWANGNNNANVNSATWQNYMDDCADSMRIRTDNCANSVVQVKNVTILCDSPYRSYFGGTSSHMASELCEYGDHAVIMVYLEVDEDLDWMENIYMTMGVYAGKQQKELLWAVRSVELCNTFIGKECSRAGHYAFAFQVSFDYGQYSDRNLFVPLIEMGFSTRADEGYNLGGVNINCKFDKSYQQYDPWYNGRRAHASQLWGAGGLGQAAGRFGIFIGVLLGAIAFGLFTYTRRSRIEFQGNDDELMDAEDKTLT